MTDAEAVALVARIANDIWNEGNLTVCEEVMAPDARYHGPHMPEGTATREDWQRAISMYRSAFPDSHVVYEETPRLWRHRRGPLERDRYPYGAPARLGADG